MRRWFRSLIVVVLAAVTGSGSALGEKAGGEVQGALVSGALAELTEGSDDGARVAASLLAILARARGEGARDLQAVFLQEEAFGKLRRLVSGASAPKAEAAREALTAVSRLIGVDSEGLPLSSVGLTEEGSAEPGWEQLSAGDWLELPPGEGVDYGVRVADCSGTVVAVRKDSDLTFVSKIEVADAAELAGVHGGRAGQLLLKWLPGRCATRELRLERLAVAAELPDGEPPKITVGQHYRVEVASEDELEVTLPCTADESYVAWTEWLDSGVDTVLELVDEDGARLARDDDGGIGRASHLEWICGAQGEHVMVIENIGSDGAFRFASDQREGQDAAVVSSVGGRLEAPILEVGKRYRGRLEATDASFWVGLECGSGRLIEFQTDRLAAGVDTVVAVFTGEGEEPLAENDDSGLGPASRLIVVCPEEPALYRVRVRTIERAGMFDIVVRELDKAPVPRRDEAIEMVEDRLELALEQGQTQWLKIPCIEEGLVKAKFDLAGTIREADRLRVAAYVEDTLADGDYSFRETPGRLEWPCGAGLTAFVRLSQTATGTVDVEVRLESAKLLEVGLGEATSRSANRGWRVLSLAPDEEVPLDLGDTQTDSVSVSIMVLEEGRGLSDLVLPGLDAEGDDGCKRSELAINCRWAEADERRVGRNRGSEALRLAVRFPAPYDGLRVGDRVMLGEHEPIGGSRNWVPPMDKFVGREATVVQLSGRDSSRSYLVQVDVDGLEWHWRTRNMALPSPR